MTPPPDAGTITVHVADYPAVKAALEAADGVCEAEESAPRALTEAINVLREALTALDVS